jgi:phage FluMu protein Com
MDGAKRVATGCIELPEYAIKGEAYECLECHCAVFPRQGEIRQAHFCHKGGRENPCRFYDPPSGNGESETHKRAKMVLMNILEAKRNLTIRRQCPRCKEVERYVIPTADIKSVHQEWAVEGGVADVVAILNDDREIIFEVYHTHRTKARPGEWYDITTNELKTKYVSKGDIVLECVRAWRCDDCEREIVEENEEREKRRARAREEWAHKIAMDRARAGRQAYEQEKRLEQERAEWAKGAEERERAEELARQRRGEQMEKLERERAEFRRQMELERIEYAKGAEQREREKQELARQRRQEREAYEVELARQKERYEVVYTDFYKRFVIDCEDVPEEWAKKDMWGEVRTDVEYDGCFFLNPLMIKSRSQRKH